MKTILDPSFRYTTSYNTDLKKTFARLRRDQRTDMQKAPPVPAPVPGNVASIVRKSAAGGN
jgi:hypothetical protein